MSAFDVVEDFTCFRSSPSTPPVTNLRMHPIMAELIQPHGGLNEPICRTVPQEETEIF
ncbi:MAG: hypothetical protein ABGZ17_17270 [Planctomycetaceae bacterium]